ncbi:zinc-binding dehydrogenase [Chloroflexi bacterium TSY]|nr:zinc-binding dehydrogenase [Chloroflexi bacterium TSY]
MKAGDTVAIECFSHCGTCLYCETGHYNHCVEREWVSRNQHGGFAEYTTAHASALFTLPQSMTIEEGALIEPLAVAYRTLSQANATYTDRVVIIGGGTIGQLCLAMAKAIGVRESAITVKYPQQAKLATDLGADHVINVNDTDQIEAVKELTDGFGMDVVIETVGGARNFDAALASVRKRGRVVLVAGYFEPLTVNLAPMVWSEAIITGSNCYGYSGMTTDFQGAIDLVQNGKVPVRQLVTHRFGFEDIGEAFATAADKRSGSIKVHVCRE